MMMKLQAILFLLAVMSSTLFCAEIFTNLSSSSPKKTYTLISSALINSADNKSSIIVNIDETHRVEFVYKKMIERVKGRDYTWLGVRATNPQERLRATYKSGVFYVHFVYENYRYTLAYIDGDYHLDKISQNSAQARENDAIAIPSSSSLLRSSNVAAAVAQIDEDAEVVINILVHYTKNFETEYGAGLDAFIQGMFDDANDALSNSLTKVTLVNVHEELLDTTYTSEAYTISTALSELSQASLEMQVKRSLYGANLVTLLRVYSTYGAPCGLAYLPSSIDNRVDLSTLFSVVEVGAIGDKFCADLTFAHEVGHNLGCAHNRTQGGTGLYPYAHGYDISGTFATVMSYETPGIAFFSNPSLTHSASGFPIGIAEGEVDSADCSKTIRRSKLAISKNTGVDEPLEVGDVKTDYHIEGSLFENSDRDSYTFYLSADTQFHGTNPKYSNWAYFLNIYDENGYLIGSYDGDFSLNLNAGRYTIVFADSSDEAGGFFSDTPTEYLMDIITTELSAPILIINATQSTNEDTNLSIAYEISSEENLSLYFDLNTSHGLLDFNATHIIYRPEANYFGQDSFIISATDSNFETDSVEVNITVVGVNDDPSLDIVTTLSVDEDSSSTLSFSLSDVEDNNLSLKIESPASHGLVSIGGALVVYTPEANYHGLDSFEVSTTDSSGVKVIKKVNVRISSVNVVTEVIVPDETNTSIVTTQQNSCAELEHIVNGVNISYNTCEYGLSSDGLYSKELPIETNINEDFEIHSQKLGSEIYFSTNITNASVKLNSSGGWRFSATELFSNASALELVYEIHDDFRTSLLRISEEISTSIYQLRAFDFSALEKQEINYRRLSDGSVDVETILTLPNSGLVIE